MNHSKMRMLRKHKIELLCAAIAIVILVFVSVPRFLCVQTSVQVKTVQERLDYMVETMMVDPMLFIDMYVQEQNGGRETAFPSCITTVEMTGSKLRSFFPHLEWPSIERARTYYISGGTISGNRDAMKKRNWDWNRHLVSAHVYMNGTRSVSLEVKMNPFRYMPKSSDLYNPTNGLGSEGILYAHSYEIARTKD